MPIVAVKTFGSDAQTSSVDPYVPSFWNWPTTTA
jgi:hypothetical protein